MKTLLSRRVAAPCLSAPLRGQAKHHPAEAIACLEFLSQNRSHTATAQLDQDATATPLSAYVRYAAQLDTEIEQAKAALSDCPPEERKSFEDALNHLLLEKEQEETNDLRWAIHPAALQRYQQIYVPNINLQLTPLLEDGVHPMPPCGPGLRTATRPGLTDRRI